MRICSYNVNGLRSAHSKNAISDLYVAANPDLLCMQETRCSEPDFNQISDYHNKKCEVVSNDVKPGYAGVGYFSTNDLHIDSDPLNIIIENDYLKGRTQTIRLLDSDIAIVNTYTLNSGGKDDLRKEWDSMYLSYIKSIKKLYKVIICGDLNVVKDENDHWAGLSNKVDCGPGLMKYEHDGLSNLLKLGFIDSFKYLYPNSDKKSWFSYRNNAYKRHHGWRIDYFLVDERLKNKIVNADILEDFLGSDHRPIILDINI